MCAKREVACAADAIGSRQTASHRRGIGRGQHRRPQPIERRRAMTWAQRLKRVVNIDAVPRSRHARAVSLGTQDRYGFRAPAERQICGQRCDLRDGDAGVQRAADHRANGFDWRRLTRQACSGSTPNQDGYPRNDCDSGSVDQARAPSHFVDTASMGGLHRVYAHDGDVQRTAKLSQGSARPGRGVARIWKIERTGRKISATEANLCQFFVGRVEKIGAAGFWVRFGLGHGIRCKKANQLATGFRLPLEFG